MTRKEFIEIFGDEDSGGKLLNSVNYDNALAGLKIIEKYLPKNGIEGAEHDMIYSVDVETLVDAGISKEDVQMLHWLNWFVENDEYLGCFV